MVAPSRDPGPSIAFPAFQAAMGRPRQCFRGPFRNPPLHEMPPGGTGRRAMPRKSGGPPARNRGRFGGAYWSRTRCLAQSAGPSTSSWSSTAGNSCGRGGRRVVRGSPHAPPIRLTPVGVRPTDGAGHRSVTQRGRPGRPSGGRRPTRRDFVGGVAGIPHHPCRSRTGHSGYEGTGGVFRPVIDSLRGGAHAKPAGQRARGSGDGCL